MAAKQAEIAVEQATEKLRGRDQTEGVNFDATMVVHCPKCGAEAKGGKFCPECGARCPQNRMRQVRREDHPRCQVLPGMRAEDLAPPWLAPVAWFVPAGASTRSGAATATRSSFHPAGEPAFVVQLGEVFGISGDGFSVRLRAPEGEIALERLGGDGPTLLEALRRDWPVLRAAVLRLAAGGRPNEVYSGNLSSPGLRGRFDGFFVGDRLILAPEGGDIVALFAADFASISFDEEAYALLATGWDGGQTVFTKLGGKTAAFAAALQNARAVLSRQASESLGRFLPTLAAGARVGLASQWLPGRLLSIEELERVAPGFEVSFVSSWLAASPRAESGRALMADLAPGNRFLGYAPPAEGDVPPLWLLALRGETASLELLSHGDYATYLFHNVEELPRLVQGLVRLPEFSREALYLPAVELTGNRGVYAIPARDLPLLKGLRACFAGRKIHAPGSSS